jgi:hypothetical protein
MSELYRLSIVDAETGAELTHCLSPLSKEQVTEETAECADWLTQLQASLGRSLRFCVKQIGHEAC